MSPERSGGYVKTEETLFGHGQKRAVTERDGPAKKLKTTVSRQSTEPLTEIRSRSYDTERSDMQANQV